MFSLAKSHNIYVLHGHYSVLIVILSVVIACCSSYTALTLNQRMQQTTFFNRHFWHLLASIAMGLGIWSMHFIGMSAFMMPIPMTYNISLTILSALPAVMASYLAFYFANRKNRTHWPVIFAGITMGIGISLMHYIGMTAMKMNAMVSYNFWVFLVSIVIAIVVSYVALFIFSTLQRYMGNYLIKIATSLLMGLAISSMHYTGMKAVVFYVNKPINNSNQMYVMNMSLIIVMVTTGIALLLIISGLANLLDRYVDHRVNYFDGLTQLPNQREFEKDLFNKRFSGTLAIIHINNLDKWINRYGYTFGDKIISIVGRSLRELKTPSTKVYQIERHRFLIFNFETDDYKTIKTVLQNVLTELSKPLIIDEFSIGLEAVCSVSHNTKRIEIKELFSNNVAVLQHPSTNYNHQVIEFDPAIHTYSLETQILQDIDQAIRNNELFIQYQPKVNSRNWELSGTEALLRWKHPKHGLISPGIFIPILEESGKIFDVTDWVIKEVCQQIASWLEVGISFGHVAVNIPGLYLTSSRLRKVLVSNLKTYNVPKCYLELEITETSVIHDIENAITSVKNLRDLGLSVALDDFGTGLSSLSYLRRIPIKTIKIDKSFVDGVPFNEKDSAVLKAILTLCSSLNLEVVIEGVETKEQVDFIITSKETPQIQGYYFSRPLLGNDLVNWIQDNKKIQDQYLIR